MNIRVTGPFSVECEICVCLPERRCSRTCMFCVRSCGELKSEKHKRRSANSHCSPAHASSEQLLTASVVVHTCDFTPIPGASKNFHDETWIQKVSVSDYTIVVGYTNARNTTEMLGFNPSLGPKVNMCSAVKLLFYIKQKCLFEDN